MCNFILVSNKICYHNWCILIEITLLQLQFQKCLSKYIYPSFIQYNKTCLIIVLLQWKDESINQLVDSQKMNWLQFWWIIYHFKVLFVTVRKPSLLMTPVAVNKTAVCLLLLGVCGLDTECWEINYNHI